MPEPITPGAKYARDLIYWNSNRGGDAPVIETYGLDRVDDDEMIMHILNALFSSKGKGAYDLKKALQGPPATPTPMPTQGPQGPIGAGISVINGKTREQVLKEQQERLGI